MVWPVVPVDMALACERLKGLSSLSSIPVYRQWIPRRHRHFCVSQAGDAHSQQLGSSYPLLKKAAQLFPGELFLQPDTTPFCLFARIPRHYSVGIEELYHRPPLSSLCKPDLLPFSHASPKKSPASDMCKNLPMAHALALRITSTK